jgi:2-polyprenyl-3-methyl-5-hydroxy-6-metoxy-1,4-benzoquinol methylase
MPERTCPLCGSPRPARIFEKQQTGYWRCPDCGFRFATPPRNPNLANAIEEYEDAYLQYLAPDRADEGNFDSLYRWMTKTTPLEGKRLLDVGAGGGKLVRYLRRRGVDAQGIEPSRALFDRFLSGDPSFACATVDEAVASGAAFPVVTAFDVIEHVADPVAFLRGIAAVLEPGGVFFASTPDVESLTARAFGRRWHFYYPYHLSYFGPRTLARAAAKHGLQLIDCRHRGRLRSVGYMIRYVAEFIARRDAPVWTSRFDSWYVPTNLFDTMHVVFIDAGRAPRRTVRARRTSRSPAVPM